jgi:hypothetical protein
MSDAEFCQPGHHELDTTGPAEPFSVYIGWDGQDYILCRCRACGQQYGELADAAAAQRWSVVS